MCDQENAFLIVMDNRWQANAALAGQFNFVPPPLGTVIPLRPSGEFFGKSPDFQGFPLFLNDLCVSRKHARIWNDSGQWMLEDFVSTNGTLVNGCHVNATLMELRKECDLPNSQRPFEEMRTRLRGIENAVPPVPLKDRDRIRIVGFEFLFCLRLPKRSWFTETVVALARNISEQERHEVWPILGDALEEAGCTDAIFLEQCRLTGPTNQKSWVAEFILNQCGCATMVRIPDDGSSIIICGSAVQPERDATITAVVQISRD